MTLDEKFAEREAIIETINRLDQLGRQDHTAEDVEHEFRRLLNPYNQRIAELEEAISV